MTALVNLVPWLVAAWLVGIGLYGIVTSRNYIHLIGCLSTVQASTYVLLLAAGYARGAVAPIFFNHPPGTGARPATAQAARHARPRGAARHAAMIADLPPIAVAGPLCLAGLLLALSTLLPRRVPDVIALTTAMAVAAICVVMATHTAQHPLVYWFGGWAPRAGHVLGIGFVVDQVGASLAAFIAMLFAATLIFAWGYFDEVHAHFHVLMLLFMAGMVGFCLTHDLFNLFVWFEVMSVAAFALTGYALRTSALEGALAFTVINTTGSYLILGGIGLIYCEVGALDFSALARGVAAAPDNPVIMASFAFLTSGLLIKGAQVPFQFWLADAHAVAPSPVSVIFSGAMVSIGIYGVAKLVWTVFAPSPEIHAVVHRLLLGMGVASAIVGGVMALIQRHIKRLLAFSTISHVGIMVIGLALLSRGGLSGLFVYIVGHGLVKAALFMVAGILLATCGGVDEIGLRGRGRRIWPVGLAMAVAGLLLAGLPIGLLDEGSKRRRGAGSGARLGDRGDHCRWSLHRRGGAAGHRPRLRRPRRDPWRGGTRTHRGRAGEG
jgi:multicomponent Na+:H+ antiporter subunit D